jgi:hypothetical protein
VRLPCPVDGCSRAYGGAAHLAAHVTTWHGWPADDERLTKYLEPLGFVRCPSCRHGAAVGAQWHHVNAIGRVPQHETCPRFAHLSDAFANYDALVAEARAVLPRLRRQHERPESLTFRVRAVVQQMAANSIAGAATALATLLTAELPARPHRDLPDGVSQLDANVRKAGKRIARGQPGRAARALQEGPRYVIRSESEATAVRALFPRGAPLPGPTLELRAHVAPRIEDAAVNRIIKRKDALSAAGPSGIGYKQLKALRKLGPEWVTAVRLISQAVADCWFADSVAEEPLAACTLTLLQKPNSTKPRPIGIGEVIVNLARSAAASIIARELAERFPDDFGLATAAGVEAAIHRAVYLLDNTPDGVLLLLDANNAFGRVLRASILEGALRYAPSAVPLLRSLYGSAGLAYFPLADGNYDTLRITRGVRQGDSLGPVLFMLAVLPVLEALRAAQPGATLLSYLDDLFLVGRPEDALAAYDDLAARLAGVGLTLNPGKCKLVSRTALDPETAAAFRDRGILELGPSADMLGSFIGPAAETHAFLAAKLAAFNGLLAAIDAGRDRGIPLQGLYKVFRFCAVPSLTHLFRTISPERTGDFAAAVRTASLDLLYRLCARDRAAAGVLPDARCTAPLKTGGLGVPDVPVIRFAAYAAATCQTARRVDPSFDELGVEDQLAWLHGRPGFTAALDGLANLTAGPHAGAAALATVAQALTDAVTAPGRSLQRHLTETASTAVAERALAMEPNPLMQAYGRSARGPESWCPFSLDHHYAGRLRDEAFRWALLLRIGYPVHPGRQQCRLCSAAADASAVHDLNCSALGNAYATLRHTAVQDAFRDAVRRVAGSVIVSNHPPAYAHYFARKSATPLSHIVKADVAVELPTGSSAPGQEYLVDFVVTGPTQANLTAARTTTGAMAAAAEHSKVKDVTDRYFVPPGKLRYVVPFGVEITGTFGASARGFTAAVAAAAPPDDDDDDDVRPLPDDDAGQEARSRRLWRLKAPVVAAAHRRNASILFTYRDRLDGLPALPSPAQATA